MRLDLIVATVDRVDELGALLDSLARQTHRDFRVLLVDQNDDDRLLSMVEAQPALAVERLHSARGLSRARNVGLRHATADLVAFPDDDCTYPPDLLERVVAAFETRPDLDALTGIAVGEDGATAAQWPSERRRVGLDTVWHGGNSHTMFLRRALLERIGGFDEAMGFGSGNPWQLAEEIDVLVRALLAGARIEQDPAVVVTHVERTFEGDALLRYARSAGGGVGYILGKHRLPLTIYLRMATRPVGGAAASLVRGDVERARYHRDVLRWRIAGYRAARRATRSANSSA